MKKYINLYIYDDFRVKFKISCFDDYPPCSLQEKQSCKFLSTLSTSWYDSPSWKLSKQSANMIFDIKDLRRRKRFLYRHAQQILPSSSKAQSFSSVISSRDIVYSHMVYSYSKVERASNIDFHSLLLFLSNFPDSYLTCKNYYTMLRFWVCVMGWRVKKPSGNDIGFFLTLTLPSNPRIIISRNCGRPQMRNLNESLSLEWREARNSGVR